jgi:aspartate-semialdehyde dehydrogenase
MKLVRETQKILDDKTIAVTATAVRVPIVGGHSEAVNVEFSNDFEVSDIQSFYITLMVS